MPEPKNNFLQPTGDLRNLQLLEEISKDSSVSQRKLSQRLGLALGLTNTCLQKMINKGLVKARGINHKRIAYYLTPKGFSEKTKLAFSFLQHTIGYYSNLKDKISATLSSLEHAGHKSILCYGAGEVMEVAFIILHETSLGITVQGIVDDDKDKQGKKLFGFLVQHPQEITKLKPDAILVTSIKYRDRILRKLNNDKQLLRTKVYSL